MAQVTLREKDKEQLEQIAREMGYKIQRGPDGEFGSKFIPDAARAFPVAGQLATFVRLVILSRQSFQEHDPDGIKAAALDQGAAILVAWEEATNGGKK